MKITQIRNATIILEYNNTRFLVDPWLMPKNYLPGFETGVNSEIRQPRVDLPFEINKIIDVDAVIITHIHPDHWDEIAEKALDKNIKIFVQSEFDKNYILSKGFTNIEILTFEGNIYNSITLYKTPTQHGKKDIIKPLCDSIGMPYDAMGIILKKENNKTVYIAGDTIWCEEVKLTIDRYKPDIIILNACGATVINGERLIMNLEDIQEVLAHTPNSTIIASHMDAVSHQTVNRKELKEFKDKYLIRNFLIPNDGETLNL